MSHWRSLLHLSGVRGRLGSPRIVFLFLFILGALACPQTPAAQIQGQPVGVIYNLQGGSWDAFNKYRALAPLNGLNLGNVSHLGAKWNRSFYVDGPNAFGVIAFDQYGVPFSPGYANGNPLNGLNQGNGAWAGAYVVQVGAFPAIAFDQMTNYANGANLNGLNAGNDNGSFLVWNGPYVSTCSGFGPSVNYIGGVASVFNVVAGYSALWVTFDGTTPVLPVVDTTDHVPYTVQPPAGTYGYAGPFLIGFNCTLTAVGGVTFPPSDCLVTTSSNLLSLGRLWSNNVVANGGAAPANSSVTAINIFAGGLNTDGVVLGTPPRIQTLNAIAPDSLIASTTPQIYVNGYQPWTNHNFVGGDLTANGLTGNAINKYLDTGLVPVTAWATHTWGFAWYDYNVTASGFTYGGYDGTHNLIGAGKYVDNNSYGYNGGNGVGNVVMVASPGNGFYADNRVSATDHRLFFASSGSAFAQIGATDAAANAGTVSAWQQYFMGINFSGALQLPCSDTLSFGCSYLNLQTSDVHNLYNRVQTLRTAFGGGFR